MGAILIVMMLELILVGALSVCGSAGFNIPSFSAAPILLHLNLGVSGLSSHGTTGRSQKFLQDDSIISRISTSLATGWKRHGILAPISNEALHNLSPVYTSPTKAPTRSSMRHSKKAFAPSMSSYKHPAKKSVPVPVPLPSSSFYKNHHTKKEINNLAPRPSNLHPPYAFSYQGVGPSISPLNSPFPSTTRWSSPANAPSPTSISNQFRPPPISPSSSSIKKAATPPPLPLLALPPPPPNEDCTSVTCTEPLTYTPPGSPCGCVWPIQVRLRLSVALYTFFPLVSELAKEIAASVSLDRSQVRIMGANAASQQLEKTIVLINLVPSRESFDESTSFLVYNKFWNKQVLIKSSLFGAYEVVYIRYPGYV